MVWPAVPSCIFIAFFSFFHWFTLKSVSGNHGFMFGKKKSNEYITLYCSNSINTSFTKKEEQRGSKDASDSMGDIVFPCTFRNGYDPFRMC